MQDDAFDVILKWNLKPILFDKRRNGFDGIFRDKANNLVIVIKKTAVSAEGFGLDCFLDINFGKNISYKEGTLEWVNEIVSRMFSPDKNFFGESLYSEQNERIAQEINQAITENKLRRVLVYHNPNVSGQDQHTPNYIMSACYDEGIWHYLGSVAYVEPEKVIVKQDILDKIKGISSDNEKKIFYEYTTKKISIFGDNCYSVEYVQNSFEEKIKDLPKWEIKWKGFDANLDNIAFKCIDYGVYARCTDKNVAEIINSIYTYNRLKYLANLVKPVANNDLTDYFIHDFIKAIALNDKNLINAYIETKIESFTDCFSTGVFGVVTNNEQKKEEFKTKFKESLTLKNVDDVEKAMLSCLNCIILKDYETFQKEIKKLLYLHNSSITPYSISMSRFFSVQTLAFYNLIYFDQTRGDKPMPTEPNHPLWDSELWHEIIDGNESEQKYIINVEKVSILLKKWMDELPDKIDLDELIRSLMI